MAGKLLVKGLHKSYDGTEVVSGLDLELEDGRSLSILGGSGCGKSTTLRMIAGLIRQDRGSIFMDGRSLDSVPPHKRKMGFVFQDYSLFSHMNVARNIEFGPRIRGEGKGSRRRSVSELLEMVGLSGFEKRKPSQLSGGQKQRVALARALAIRPSLLLLDEPFGALDISIRKTLRRDLRRMQSEMGLSMLFVTHDQEEAFEVGDRIAIMHGGRFDQVGRPRDLYEKPATRYVAGFIGSMNVIPMKKKGSNLTIEALVRPEDIVISPSAPPFTGPLARIMNYNFLGSQIEVVLATSEGQNVYSIIPKKEFMDMGYRRGDMVKVETVNIRTFRGGTLSEKTLNGSLYSPVPASET